MDVQRKKKIKRLFGKGGSVVDRIIDQYCDMLSYVKAEEGFEEKLLNQLMEIQEEGKKKHKKNSRNRYSPKIAYVTAALLFCIGIFLFRTPIAAAVKDIFENFYNNFSCIYEIETQQDKIVLNKEIITKSGSKIWIKDGVITDQGITVRYEIKKKGKSENIYPDSCKMQLSNGWKISFDQCVYMPVSTEGKLYVVSFETKQKEKLKKLEKQKVNCRITFLEERQDSMWEEPLNIQIPIESVHSLKKRKTDSVWKHGKDGTDYRITEVTENIWYMEVKYQWKSKNEDFFLFQFSDENDMTYADLGAVADKNGDGSYSGSIYYEIPKKDIEKMIFSPIRIKEKYDDEREIMDGESIIINGGEYDEK